MADLPRSASYEAAIQNILQQMATLPLTYNLQRRQGMYEGAAALNREGYTDATDVAQDATDPQGNITYRLVRGLDGRLYRQRFRQTNAAAAASGTYGSSFNQRDLREGKHELDTARESAIRGYEAGQQSLTLQQAGQYRDYASSLGGANAEYADWRAQQPVALPADPAPMPSVTPNASVGAPLPGSGVNSNRAAMGTVSPYKNWNARYAKLIKRR